MYVLKLDYGAVGVSSNSSIAHKWGSRSWSIEHKWCRAAGVSRISGVQQQENRSAVICGIELQAYRAAGVLRS
jgi:hypothetical protein